jgi:hypothetical protein
MFTTIKRALTALTITASLLTPISANAGELSREESATVLTNGKILSVSVASFDAYKSSFVIEYRGKILVCIVAYSVGKPDVYVMCKE